jgi:hypothetical protein
MWLVKQHGIGQLASIAKYRIGQNKCALMVDRSYSTDEHAAL